VESWGEGRGGRWGLVGADHETGGVGTWHSGRGAATAASSEYGGEHGEDYRLPLGCDWAGQLIPHGLGRQYPHLQSSSAHTLLVSIHPTNFPLFSLFLFLSTRNDIIRPLYHLSVVCSQFLVTSAIEKHVDLDHGGSEAKQTAKFNTICFGVI
jgi:hypothetical protein